MNSCRIPDIRIGGLDMYKSPGSEFVSTNAYMKDDIAWCVSAPKELPKFLNFYVVVRDLAFPVIAVISFYIGSTILYVFSANEPRPLNFHECHMQIFQILLNMATVHDAIGFRMRIAYVFTSLCCLVANVIVVAYYTTFQISPGFWCQARNTKEMIEYKFQLSGQIESLQLLQTGRVVSQCLQLL